MKIVDRRRVILETLQESGSAEIDELAKKTGVSSMTVRRDLKELASRGSVSVLRGTAVLNDGALREYNMLVKHEINIEEKRRIARRALEYISDGDSIFLDAGTTVRELALLVAGKGGINVMTHSLLAADALVGSKGARVIMCPGELREMSMAFMGPLTDDFVSMFEIDVQFLSVEGISLEDGVSVIDVSDGHSKKVLIERAKKVVLLADNSKFEKSFFYKVAPLSKVDVVLTDVGMADETYEEYSANGVEVIRV